jgi:anti-sigma-K factor RskA
MTPSNTSAKSQIEQQRREDDVAGLIVACGRDERPALQGLYKLTSARLYGLALKAAGDRHEADQALAQSYLAIFNKAGGFDPERDDATAWLVALLARHLPQVARLDKAAAVKPVQPPPELWQKLDIGLGLQRLDRHIKPGVATQPRGRDPMPNAHDRRSERRLRFWRVTGVASFLAFAVAMAAIVGLGLQGSSWGFLALPSGNQPDAPQVATLQVAALPAPALGAAPATVATTGSSRWLAILQPAAGSRVWRVEHEAGALAVTAMPAFALEPDQQPSLDGAGLQVLALWAVAGPGGGLHYLGDLDPAATTSLALPAALDDAALELFVSLEAGKGESGAQPSGPLLFAGGRVP